MVLFLKCFFMKKKMKNQVFTVKFVMLYQF